jgi:hypothetical protein
VDGFSKFWSYNGNGSADWPFVYTGFKPRYLMIKNISVSNTDWIIFDTQRSNINPVWWYLFAQSPSTENVNWVYNDFMDILSNGFKLRNWTYNDTNWSYTYIYAAFAELPFK